jgi:hypothetical protein
VEPNVIYGVYQTLLSAQAFGTLVIIIRATDQATKPESPGDEILSGLHHRKITKLKSMSSSVLLNGQVLRSYGTGNCSMTTWRQLASNRSHETATTAPQGCHCYQVLLKQHVIV